MRVRYMCWIHFTEFHFTNQLILVLRCTLDVLHARGFVPRLLRLDAREVRLRLGACLPVPALWLRRKGEGERLAGKSRIFSSSEQRAGRAGRWVGGSTYLPHGARDEAEAHADGNLSAHVNLSGCDGMGEGMSTSVKRPGIVPRSHARGKKMGPPLRFQNLRTVGFAGKPRRTRVPTCPRVRERRRDDRGHSPLPKY